MPPLKKLLQEYYYMPDLVIWRFVEVGIVSEYFSKYYKGGTIIDIGCGDGVFGALAINGPIDIGMDLDIAELKKQDMKNSAYKYLALANATKMPFKNNGFKFILSNSVIEHINDLNSALHNIKSILCFGGTFILTVPSIYFLDNLLFAKLFRKVGLSNLAKVYMIRQAKRLNIKYILSAEEWRSILSKFGLSLVEYRYYMPRRAEFLYTVFFEICGFRLFKISILGIIKRVADFFGPKNYKPLKNLLINFLSFLLKDAFRADDSRVGMGLCMVVSSV
jgi:SAM-dependent methyltransferase